MQFDEDEIGDMGFLGCCAPILRTLCCSPCSGKYITVIVTSVYWSAQGTNVTLPWYINGVYKTDSPLYLLDISNDCV